jgi:hypothetical protein
LLDLQHTDSGSDHDDASHDGSGEILRSTWRLTLANAMRQPTIATAISQKYDVLPPSPSAHGPA